MKDVARYELWNQLELQFSLRKNDLSKNRILVSHKRKSRPTHKPKLEHQHEMKLDFQGNVIKVNEIPANTQ